MGFVKLTPASGKVTGTHSNFPVYVDLSLIGVTTLAEAQSVRVYSDEAKTTELAREIVSASECHIKISSLTSTTDIWMDWDGVRSDYAVTDTYGRNAVWSDYDFVSHAGGGDTDSTGNGLTGTAFGGVTSGGASGVVGAATTYDGTNDYYSYGDVLDYIGHVNVYISVWAKRNGTLPDFWSPISKQGGTSLTDQYEIRGANSTIIHDPVMQIVGSGSNYDSSSATLGGSITMADATWYLFHGQANAADDTISLYMNAASAGSQTHASYSIQNTSSPFKIGVQTVSVNRFFKGEIDEVRVGQTIRSADWITTEYNNQSDVAAFWVATPVSGGAPDNGFMAWW
jgi:hypothetical protein